MNRRKALKAVVAGCIGMLSGQAIFTRPAKSGIIDEVSPNGVVNNSYQWKPNNVRWDMGSIETVTLVFGDKTLVLKTKDIFDSLST